MENRLIKSNSKRHDREKQKDGKKKTIQPLKVKRALVKGCEIP